MSEHPLRKKWRTQRFNAKKRAVPFLLTFEEWLQIWEQSGRLSERGCHRGQYVMARYGDVGPYTTGNVRIVLSDINNSEWIRTPEIREKFNTARKGKPEKKHSEATKRKISSIWKRQGHPKGMLGKQQTQKQKATMRQRMAGKNNPNFGKKASEKTRAKQSVAQQARFAKESRNAK